MAIRAYKVGFISTDTPGDLLFLEFKATCTSGRYQSLFKDDANFTVTAGMNLYIARLLISPQAANGGILELGYGDTIVNDSVAAPTNAKPMIAAIQGPTAFELLTVDLGGHPVPANKAVYFRSGGADTKVTLCGIMF